jgi:type II secretory pathway component PulF
MDESGVQRTRLHRLAGLLQQGVTLPDAVEEVHGVLSEEDALAVRFGIQSGALAATLRDRLNQPEFEADQLPPHFRKSFVYLCLVFTVALVVVTFLQIKIVPALREIAQEFGISPPWALTWSVYLADRAVHYWYLLALGVIALWLLLFSAWPGRQLRLGIFGRLFRPLRDLSTADVLQKLSVATKTGRPLPGAISTLARYHFDPALRHRLLFIRNELEQGVQIWQSMLKVGLLDAQETHALETADRVGNRPWVLNQLALRKKRRSLQRFANWSELAFPIIVILVGAFVLMEALSVFGSLVSIVYSLL